MSIELDDIEKHDFAYQSGAIENPLEYKPGGYCPIELYDTYKRWIILHKMHHDIFSTWWLVHEDEHDRYGTMKIRRADVSLIDSDREKNFIDFVLKDPNGEKIKIPLPMDSFFIESPNGIHEVTVFDGILFSAAATVGEMKEIPRAVRNFMMREISASLSYIHELGYIHGDVNLQSLFFHIPNLAVGLSREEVDIPDRKRMTADELTKHLERKRNREENEKSWKYEANNAEYEKEISKTGKNPARIEYRNKNTLYESAAIILALNAEKSNTVFNMPHHMSVGGHLPPKLYKGTPMPEIVFEMKNRINWSICFGSFNATRRISTRPHARHEDTSPPKLLTKNLGNIAPESVFLGEHTVASDIWSLGAVFHHLLAGRSHFEMWNFEDVEELLEQYAEVLGVLPSDLMAKLGDSSILKSSKILKEIVENGGRLKAVVGNKSIAALGNTEDHGYPPACGLRVKTKAPIFEGFGAELGRRIFSKVPPTYEVEGLKSIVDLIISMMQYQLEKRPSAAEVFSHFQLYTNGFTPLKAADFFTENHEQQKERKENERFADFSKVWEMAKKEGPLTEDDDQSKELLKKIIGKYRLGEPRSKFPGRYAIANTSLKPLKRWEYSARARLYNTSTDPSKVDKKGFEWPVRNWAQHRLLPPHRHAQKTMTPMVGRYREDILKTYEELVAEAEVESRRGRSRTPKRMSTNGDLELMRRIMMM